MFSFAWVRVPTYTSTNCLTSVDFLIQEGSPICGIPLPTFGDYADATFSNLEVGAPIHRENEGVWHAVFTPDVDLDPWSRAPFPSIGASGLSPKKRAPPRITGLRAKPPTLEAQEYNGRTSENFRGPAALSALS